MHLRCHPGPWLVAIALWASAASPARAQAVAGAAPFAADIRAFEQLDSKSTAPSHAVLFVGSSSIRLWPTADRFRNLTVINRGFGGSTIADVNRYVQQTVLKYAPDVVVFYAGDNDIGTGKTPAEVQRDYATFVDRVLAARPDTEIVFIAIKPSLARWQAWPTMKAANDLIQKYSATNTRLHFADVAPPMLGADGRPKPNLFVEDGLHMTPAGYDIWTDVVGRVVAPLVTSSARR